MLRGCLQIEGSSLLWIILEDFRFKFGGLYTKVDITPSKRIEKLVKNSQKIDEHLCLYRPPPLIAKDILPFGYFLENQNSRPDLV